MPSMTLTCAICNLPMQKSRTSKPQGEAAHNPCRSGRAEATRLPNGSHGQGGYARGCRCEVCRLAKNDAMKRYFAKFRQANGESQNARWRREFKAENGYWPQRGGGDWISPKLRQQIYDRDKLNCYLCDSQLDRLVEINHPKAPTIDHVIPRSKGGSDDLDNLKTCCRECNVLKADSMPTM